MKKTYSIGGLDCAHCAQLLEEEFNKIDGVQQATLDFVAGKLRVTASLSAEELTDRLQACIADNEPDAILAEEGTSLLEDGKIDREWFFLGGAAVLFIAGLLVPHDLLRLLFCLLAWGIAGWKTVLGALRNLFKGKLMDETLLMTLATVGAFAIGEYPEAAAVMLFFNLGELVQEKAVNRSRKLITSLMDIKPDHANVLRETGIFIVPPEEVQPGEKILVKAGERVPLDGWVSAGKSSLDLSALNGESLPKEVSRGDEVLSGAINVSGVVEITVSKPYSDSTVARILDLVENASARKARTERFITRFSHWYTPTVVGAAAALAILLPLITGDPFTLWFERALTFLVVSCPCALVVSIPLSFSAGIGAASKMGVLVKGGTALEMLAKVKTVVLDKTGTLTQGRFTVAEVTARPGFTAEEVLFCAAHAESGSTHPIALAIAGECKVDPAQVSQQQEIAGSGVSALVAGREVRVGKAALCGAPEEDAGENTTVFVSVGGQYAGNISVRDALKEGSAAAVKALREQGAANIVLLTGDARRPALAAGREAGVDQVFTPCCRRIR